MNRPTVDDELPDFRNMGVLLHALVYAHLLLVMYTLPGLGRWGDWAGRVTEASLWLEMTLLPSLALLALLSPWLMRVPFRVGLPLVCGVILLCNALGNQLLKPFEPEHHARFAGELLCLLATLGFLGILRLRQRALSPRLSEARLSALQARIRPHFFFNSLNAVLAMIRSEPAKAEQALQDIADLFRVVMQDNRRLSRLAREVELAEHYINIEMLRLGDRLKVEWHTEQMPANAAVPPLMLQPLIENAVYYGIEPALEPGPIQVNIFRTRNDVHIDVKNPPPPPGYVRTHKGNGMALDNIRERLLLHFDAEASLTTQATSDYYQVHIVVPYREIPHDDTAAPFSR
ncbi:Sensor histidine kinase YpdA [Andreprevotia sp. IGB-42]|uniref:sensor histidine kinase n=1 Tax=Andreprevotia sp. IGB-42 TaxID=2497473 RepID=UPI0013571603|nr:histidine kinase [Andreprevotia sp. IGB-42]KAF0812405.1 Sensor histidine kinase YpdA [Andreprevotia sp. IGB-42]